MERLVKSWISCAARLSSTSPSAVADRCRPLRRLLNVMGQQAPASGFFPDRHQFSSCQFARVLPAVDAAAHRASGAPVHSAAVRARGGRFPAWRRAAGPAPAARRAGKGDAGGHPQSREKGNRLGGSSWYHPGKKRTPLGRNHNWGRSDVPVGPPALAVREGGSSRTEDVLALALRPREPAIGAARSGRRVARSVATVSASDWHADRRFCTPSSAHASPRARRSCCASTGNSGHTSGSYRRSVVGRSPPARGSWCSGDSCGAAGATTSDPGGDMSLTPPTAQVPSSRTSVRADRAGSSRPCSQSRGEARGRGTRAAGASCAR